MVVWYNIVYMGRDASGDDIIAIKKIDTDFWADHALDVIKNQYGDSVSIESKKKDLVKFGTHTSVGTGWETLAEMQGTETGETYVSGNDITQIISDDADGEDVVIEGHTWDGSTTTFITQTVRLTGTTTADLTTPLYRVSRVYNAGSNALVGNIAVFEGGSTTLGVVDDATTVHLYIPAGEQQSQKASTTISGTDYWIITDITLSVTEKTASWAEARLEFKPVGTTFWRPMAQNFSAADSSGLSQLIKNPYLIVPPDHDVRIAVKCNTANIKVAGGFSGFLAKVI